MSILSNGGQLHVGRWAGAGGQVGRWAGAGGQSAGGQVQVYKQTRNYTWIISI